MTEPTNATTAEESRDDSDAPIAPLSEMLIANGDLIEYCLESYGPSAVAEFFVNVGTSMAVAYDLHTGDDGKFIPAPTVEG